MAIFPGAVSTDSDLYIAVNQKTTQLTDNPLTAGATTANVVSTSGFPSVGFISIDAEIIHYTGITATSFTGLTRGADGTVAASHAQNSQVYHNVIAAHHNVLKDEIIAIESNLSSRIGLSATQIQALNGSASLPSHSFVNDTDTGIYRSASNQIGFATGGIDRLFVDDNAITGNKPAQFLDGTTAAPSYSFFNDPDTGIYSNAANVIGISSAGTTYYTLDANFHLNSSATVRNTNGSAATPSYTFDVDTDTGIYRSSANQLDFATGGVQRLAIASSLITSLVDFTVGSGGKIFVDGGSDTYILEGAANRISMVVGGNTRFNLENAFFSVPNADVYVTATNRIYLDSGDATSIYESSDNVIDLVSNGTTSLRVDNSATATHTRLLIYDVDNATLERVTVGAADSGGAGFKVLRIPN